MFPKLVEEIERRNFHHRICERKQIGTGDAEKCRMKDKPLEIKLNIYTEDQFYRKMFLLKIVKQVKAYTNTYFISYVRG